MGMGSFARKGGTWLSVGERMRHSGLQVVVCPTWGRLGTGTLAAASTVVTSTGKGGRVCSPWRLQELCSTKVATTTGSGSQRKERF